MILRKKLAIASVTALIRSQQYYCTQANSLRLNDNYFDDHVHSHLNLRGRELQSSPHVTAVYDSELTAPRCFDVGIYCASTTMISGAGYCGPEANAPNTIDDCDDFNIGTYQEDESIENIIVMSVDGGPLAVGKEAKIEAYVQTAHNATNRNNPGRDDIGHFFYTPNAYSKEWTYVTSKMTATGKGLTILSAQFMIQPGNTTQAIRLSYGYAEYAISPCHRIDQYYDVDDLVFEVDHSLITKPVAYNYTATNYGPPSAPEVWLTASFNTQYSVPMCDEVGTRCDTGNSMISGVGDFELNSPNSANACSDTPGSSVEKYESIEGIMVRTMDHETMTAGKWAQIRATVHSPPPDTTNRTDVPGFYHMAHFYHFSTATGQNTWKYITSRFTRDEGGTSYLFAHFILPPGEFQVVRVIYGYGNPLIGSCLSDSWEYHDVDDLIFRVLEPLPTPAPTTSLSTPPPSPTSPPTPFPTPFPTSIPTSLPTALPSHLPTSLLTFTPSNLPTRTLTSLPTLSISAEYDPQLKAPRCFGVAGVCDTGKELISGVGTHAEGGPEPNAPNTLDGCEDSSVSVYQQDESIERIKIRSVDGDIMTIGREVEVVAVVYTASSTADRDEPNGPNVGRFFYATDASNIDWKYIATYWLGIGSGFQTFTAKFTLLSGSSVQAIRLAYGYAEYGLHSCLQGSIYQDTDDLVFQVDDEGYKFPTFSPTTSPTFVYTSMEPTQPTVSPSLQPTATPSFPPSLQPLTPPSLAPSPHPTSPPSRDITWAIFDSHFSTPRCFDISTTCDSGDTLIAGVDGQELNSPNTIDRCEDFFNSTLGREESIERILISSVDGEAMSVGKEVEVKAVVRTALITYNRDEPGEKDVGHFFYTPDAETKDWEYIASHTIETDSGTHTILARFMLQPGNGTQAIRLSYGYAEYAMKPCDRRSTFYDVDDLVFDVNHDIAPPTASKYIAESEDLFSGESILLTAEYDKLYSTPRCFNLSSACDTGSVLIKGAAGHEENSPNSADECEDFANANSEAIERMMIRSLNGQVMSVGSWVEILAVVKTPSRSKTPNEYQVANFYHSTNATNAPEWNYIATRFALIGSGYALVSCKLMLPPGDTQIVRLNYGFGDFDIGPCTSQWQYLDIDDLVFAVAEAPTPLPSLEPSLIPSMTPTTKSSSSLPTTSSPTIVPSSFLSGDSLHSSRNIAEYDDFMGAPLCSLGSLCDSDILLRGVGSLTIGGSEQNAPNTIDSCGRGEHTINSTMTTPVFHRGESVDRIVIRSVDSGSITVGSEVEVEITLYSPDDTSSRSIPNKWSIAHVYYTANAKTITEMKWKYLWSESVEPGRGEQVFKVRFFLISAGADKMFGGSSTQAIRVNYAYAQYKASPCFDDSLDHGYVDTDDLVFEVQELIDESVGSSSPTVAPTSSARSLFLDTSWAHTLVILVFTIL